MGKTLALLSELLIFKNAPGSAVGVGMRKGRCAAGSTCLPRGPWAQKVPFPPAAGLDTPRLPGRLAGQEAWGSSGSLPARL